MMFIYRSLSIRNTDDLRGPSILCWVIIFISTDFSLFPFGRRVPSSFRDEGWLESIRLLFWIRLLVCIWILKVLPTPTLLWTLTDPPICSISCRHMLSPRPVPRILTFECSSSLPKLMNSLSKFSGDIPMPLSSISILNFMYSWVISLLVIEFFLYCPNLWSLSNLLMFFYREQSSDMLCDLISSVCVSINVSLTVICPLESVNFREFDKKFSKIYRYLLQSPYISLVSQASCSLSICLIMLEVDLLSFLLVTSLTSLSLLLFLDCPSFSEFEHFLKSRTSFTFF